MRALPSSYWSTFSALPCHEVSYGVGGVSLFRAEEIEKAQTGYSVAPDGSSLITEDDGSWDPDWVVIGYETALGDPIFCDTASAPHPVFTAWHGGGTWEPIPLAPSLDLFLACYRLFAEFVSKRAEVSTELDANPAAPEELEQYEQDLTRLVEGEDVSFWIQMVTKSEFD